MEVGAECRVALRLQHGSIEGRRLRAWSDLTAETQFADLQMEPLTSKSRQALAPYLDRGEKAPSGS